jgi:ubiquinol-cytochrome c reductase cytochrome b subunit
MFMALVIILVLPITDLGATKGLQFRPLSKLAFYIFVINFVILQQLGAKHVESPFIEFGQISTILYFAHFLVIVPLVSIIENTLIDLTTTKSS